MTTGELNRRIKVKSLFAVSDDAGGVSNGNEVVDFETWAKVEPIKSTSKLLQGLETLENTYKITVRFSQGRLIDITKLIEYQKRNLTIDSIQTYEEGFKQYLIIIATDHAKSSYGSSFIGLWGHWMADVGANVDGDTVTYWEDQSGRQHTLQSSNPPNYPKYMPFFSNGKPAVYVSVLPVSFITADKLKIEDEAVIFIVGYQLYTGSEGDFGGFLRVIDNFSINRFNQDEAICATVGNMSLLNATPIPINYLTPYTIRLRITKDKAYLAVNNGAEVETERAEVADENILIMFPANCNKAIAECMIFLGHTSNTRIQTTEKYLKDKYNHY